MLKLWGRATSVNVQKVLWCLQELALPFERVDAGGSHGVVGTDAYRRMNPNGLVPVLEDDDFVLWESNAIVRYLCSRHGGEDLWPTDARARADADRWMDWQATEFTPAMRDAFLQLVRVAPADRDADLIVRSCRATERCAALLDAHLADREHLTPHGFTIGDLAVGCAAHRWLNLPIDQTPRPALSAWYRRLAGRPAAEVLRTPIG